MPCLPSSLNFPSRTFMNMGNLTAVVSTHMLGFREEAENSEVLCNGNVSHPSHSSGRHRHRDRCHLGGLGCQTSGAGQRTPSAAYRTEPSRAERALTPQPRGGPAYQA